MMCAGWIRFRASLMATRRTSWIDHRINDEAAMALFLRWFDVAFFLASADWHDGGITAIMAKASITMDTWRCQPCQERLSL